MGHEELMAWSPEMLHMTDSTDATLADSSLKAGLNHNSLIILNVVDFARKIFNKLIKTFLQNSNFCFTNSNCNNKDAV